MKPIHLFLLIVILSGSLVAQENADLKKCIAFVFINAANQQLLPNGTGFFVGVNSEIDTSELFIYFVTAKHVLRDQKGKFFKEIHLRMNTRSGNTTTLSVPLFTQGQIRFLVPSDSTVDLAVIPLLPDVERFDFLCLPIEMIASKDVIKKKQIREGDDVFFCGLFQNYYGELRNYPIFRFGKVALLTDERVLFENELSELYILETTSFGGNSGSPVFFKLGSMREPKRIAIGGSQYFLAGVMRGYFGALIDTAVVETKRTLSVPFQNAGIAGVVPAYLLLDLLNSPVLKQQRQAK